MYFNSQMNIKIFRLLCFQFFKSLSRRKTNIDQGPLGESEVKLARVLGLTDLTLLGVGATLGVGVYVLGGSVAKNLAGPAVIISFLAAAIASFFSGNYVLMN